MLFNHLREWHAHRREPRDAGARNAARPVTGWWQATGRTILTASSGDTDALEGYRGHGLFHLQRAGSVGDVVMSDGNGTIEVAELAAYVHAGNVAQ